MVGGDHLSAAIAAASIVAKVTRDRVMRGLHESYPVYGFDHHVGYATAATRRRSASTACASCIASRSPASPTSSSAWAWTASPDC